MIIASIILSLSVMVDVEWTPHPGPQTELLSRSEFELLYGGARGGGKSEAGLAWLIEPEYLNHSSYRALVIRRNADDLSDWISRARAFYRGVGGEVAGKPATISFPSGSVIRTGHLKDENAFEKYQGHEYQKILIEELTQIAREEDYLKLISSCRSSLPELRPQVMGTTNPGGAGHTWVKQRFVDVARNATYYDAVSGRSRIFIPAKIEDNPTLMKNDPDYVRFLDSLPEDLRKAWRDGDWDIFAGQYFKKLRREKHITAPFHIPDSWTRFRSLDWGYNHDTVCIWWAVAHDGNAYITQFYKKAGVVVSDMARSILAQTQNEDKIITTLADPSIWAKNPYSTAPTDNTMADVMRTCGLYIQKANNDRVNGWNALRELLEWDAKKEPKLKIFANAEDIFDGLTALVYDDKRPEDVLKTDGDDIGDAVRYGALHIYAGLQPEKKLNTEEKFVQSIVTGQMFFGEHQAQQWDNL